MRNILLRDYKTGALTIGDKTNIGPTNIQSAGSGCICNYFLESAEFNFILDNLSFSLKDIILDVILLTNVPSNCNDPFIFTQSYSAKFVNSMATSFVRSGAPGYLQGSRLLVGYNTTNNGNIQFNVPYDGIYLMGRKQDGTCSDITIDSAIRLQSIFDTPILYGVNMVYSCTNNFALRDLQNFCQGKKWQNYVLYNFIKNIQYIGVFGNANNTYIKVF